MPTMAERIRRPELPVLGRELRSTMRGRRLIARLAVAGLLPVALGFLILLLIQAPDTENTTELLRSLPFIGRAVFLALVAAEFLLLTVLAPALTAGAFTAEGEAQTLEPLLLTPLSSANLVAGKLLCAAGTLALLLLCGFPIAGVAALYGGIVPADLAWTQGILAATLLFAAALGLYISTLARRTIWAMLVAYAATVLLLLWPLGFFVFIELLGNFPSETTVQIVLYAAALLPAAGLATPIMHGCAPWVRGRLAQNLRRRRWALFTLWGSVFLGAYASAVYGLTRALADFRDNVVYLFLGNPFAALALHGAVMYYPIYEEPSAPPLIEYFIPATLVLLLLGTLLLCWATVQRVNLLRRPE
ncbi:MAG TPA: ABC transporter permease subunit [Armatimonadota bacterium]|nr:ABC transporter permease subunit [Armatimonadota bacterium]